MENPNFLILDEPTNDLDLGTLTALENYLLDFNGCVVIVSHDRYFLDRICEHLFVFEGEGKVRDFPGNYTEYREHERLNPVTETTKVKKVQKAISQEVKTKVSKLTYKEKIEMEKSAKELEKLETDKSKLEFKLSSGDLSGQEINDVSVDLGKLMEKIEEVTMIWMELAEKDEA
jgi:ATP-binding cassette subfamily F protein uup